MKIRGMFLVLVAICVVSALPAQARGRKSATPKEPGTYKEWGPDIDKIQIVQAFNLSDYDRIVVVPFDSSRTELPEKDDNTYEPVLKMLDEVSDDVADAMRKELPGPRVETAERAPKSAKTLIVRGTVDDMNPGSRAARYWAGYGAGAAVAELSGEIVDAKSGAVLLRFTQQRRSSGMMSAGGGDYMKLMRGNVRTIGEDIAHMLSEF